jgi:hypothetical protein
VERPAQSPDVVHARDKTPLFWLRALGRPLGLSVTIHMAKLTSLTAQTALERQRPDELRLPPQPPVTKLKKRLRLKLLPTLYSNNLGHQGHCFNH